MTFAPDASIVLVGIWGTGKRSLGLIAATAQGRRFITEDHYFRLKTGLSRQDYLKLHGSEEFHKHDVEISCQTLKEHKTGCVIDCGLGSLTSALQDFLKTYSQTNPVIHRIRDMDSIKALLQLNERSVKFLENGDSAHRRSSNYEYDNLEDNSADIDAGHQRQDRDSPLYSFMLREVQAEFTEFVKMITHSPSTNDKSERAFSLTSAVCSQPFTHASRLPFSAYEDMMIDLTSLEPGGDIVEILVDRCKSGAIKVLSRMVADTRRCLRIPVLVTIAHDSQSSDTEAHLNILRHSVRLAVDPELWT